MSALCCECSVATGVHLTLFDRDAFVRSDIGVLLCL